jgi:hypothetical protein
LHSVSRVVERAELAEKNLKNIEDELQMVGENMKQLELSAEKAVEREEKLKDKILQIQYKYKAAEGRWVQKQTMYWGQFGVGVNLLIIILWNSYKYLKLESGHDTYYLTQGPLAL